MFGSPSGFMWLIEAVEKGATVVVGSINSREIASTAASEFENRVLISSCTSSPSTKPIRNFPSYDKLKWIANLACVAM